MVPAFILIITNIFINTRIKIQNIVLVNDAFAKIIKTVIADVLKNMMNYGIVLLASSMILIIAFNLIKVQKNKIEKNA